jgi:hypothetical protein
MSERDWLLKVLSDKGGNLVTIILLAMFKGKPN